MAILSIERRDHEGRRFNMGDGRWQVWYVCLLSVRAMKQYRKTWRSKEPGVSMPLGLIIGPT